MSLYASYVCLCILASSRIPRYILRRRTPTFQGGSVTVQKLDNLISQGQASISTNRSLSDKRFRTTTVQFRRGGQAWLGAWHRMDTVVMATERTRGHLRPPPCHLSSLRGKHCSPVLCFLPWQLLWTECLTAPLPPRVGPRASLCLWSS
jgi:hypothetical protein